MIYFCRIKFGMLGKQDAADATLETLKAIEHPVAKSVEVLVEICAFAGSLHVFSCISR